MSERQYDNFDEFARDYREIHTESLKLVGGDSEVYSRVKADWIANRLKDTHAGKLLDFGCGDGIMASMLGPAMPDWKFYGLDVSEESIEVAKSRNLKNAEWTTFNGFHFPYETSLFDVIFVANVFHHIAHEHHIGLLKEFRRVLKAGGKVFYFEHNPYNPVTRHIVNTCPFDKDAVLVKPSRSRDNFKSAGFQDVKVDYVLFFPRHKLFTPFWSLEPMFKHVPLGGQYVISAQ